MLYRQIIRYNLKEFLLIYVKKSRKQKKVQGLMSLFVCFRKSLFKISHINSNMRDLCLYIFIVVYYWLIVMESPNNEQNHLLDNLLNEDCHPHEIFVLNNLELDVDNEEKKNITGSKKKGRPKGLKTNKGKCSSKEESKDEKLNKGHWLQEQNKKYHWFLEMYSKHFIQKQLRRMDKIFKTMAQFIGTREAEQCRSHHQKMQKKYHSFYKIIRNLRFQFFSSADPIYIKNELQGNQIYDYDPLIPEQALENQNEVVAVDEEKQYEKECDLSLGKNMNNQNNSFMLGDNYQSSFKYQAL